MKLKTFLIALSFLFCLGACDKKPVAPVKITAQEAMGLVANNFGVIIDVRETEETKDSGMAAPARNIPTSVLNDDANFEKFAKEMPKDKQIVFYCASGARAERAAERLASKGYKTAFFSSFSEWKSAGLPVKQP